MKLAYLIMAHDNFMHLERLVKALDEPDTQIYLHVDRRSEIPKSAVFRERVKLIPRLETEWGAHAQLRASIDLLEIAAPADYYLLISGSDYPLCSRQTLERILAKAPLFINSKPVPFPSKPLKRFTRYHFKNLARRKPQGKTWLLLMLEKLLKRLPFARRVPLKLYAGSTWFAFSDSVRSDLLQIHHSKPNYESFFENCLCPDEAFFQSLLACSKYQGQEKPNLTFLKWSENQSSPKVLKQEDLHFMLKENSFNDLYGCHEIAFGRKFNDKSNELCDWIDQNLRSL